ncbi:hypothetical protein [Flavobacterium sp.]|uniref:hypothetical protein n=1 Tax=Flavobacterium sp. TaxID=239 RepID=UPI0022BD83B4|nr:hypothetical protein [Flavobacterium sp.]MCZ8091402.1 hypothetical protein [Flavobacterium sp.]
MKQIIFTLILFFNLNGFSQKNETIDYIKFNYNSSVVLQDDVNITIMPYLKGNEAYSITVEMHDKIKKINISEKKFKEIFDKILKIDNSELIKSFRVGLDGATTTLEIGGLLFNSIKYHVWGIYKKDSSRPKKFLKAVQIILKTADVKIDDLN